MFLLVALFLVVVAVMYAWGSRSRPRRKKGDPPSRFGLWVAAGIYRQIVRDRLGSAAAYRFSRCDAPRVGDRDATEGCQESESVRLHSYRALHGRNSVNGGASGAQGAKRSRDEYLFRRDRRSTYAGGDAAEQSHRKQ